MELTKKDIIISVIISELTALYFIFLFSFNYNWVLTIIFPILGALGIRISYLVGKKFLFIYQLAKFLLIGTAAALVDLGILNLLIFASGVSVGLWFSVFKATSFIIAFSAKFLGDKLWAFEKKEVRGVGKEFSKFFGVTLVGLLINVVVASLVVRAGSGLVWANVSGIIAAIATVLWNFPMYKFIVFKKNE